MPKNPFLKEAWSEYAAGILIFSCRFLCRYRMVGWKWDGDDYFAIVAATFWTAGLSLLHIITHIGTISNITNEIALTLSEERKSHIVMGSKALLAAWCIYISLIWSLKACMLFLYGRLTLDLKQRNLVKICAVLCGLTYAVAIIVTFTHCLPLHKKWQVYPYPGDVCAVYIPNFYVITIMNVGTDILIAFIPLPLLWKVRMSWQKKLFCGIWLCTGVLMIVATLLRGILSLSQIHSINTRTIWSTRETFIGIIAVNMPILGPCAARKICRLSRIKSKNSCRSNSDGGESGHQRQPSGGNRLSIMERKAKQERIQGGLDWALAGGSVEHIVPDDYEMYSTLSSRATTETCSTTREQSHTSPV